MDPVDTQSLLLQMRALAAQAEAKPVADNSAEAVASADKTASFSDLLTQSIDAVNAEQQKSAEMKNAFERGDPDADLTEVMVQVQKASLSFQAMTQVRNKLVEAYKEVIQMPI
ncbi:MULTISPECIES: flagellar hook-basal body complex protein FliE [Thiomicrorhabdus]|uniref:Flagellar hook-basal body complex protein FliE n=1 Tax=Thiomicrorhabdus heinhorstiae TaxID=2748010 RepID=A0ABS0C278_9GAMM|nr:MULTISPECIES: flagellar hook-basal body complex protein FliE [Thiomicrorhabdus]MBF6058382.1 flagellar hook-basal body complex protein FliE [Thiomicrorhabdus heinhorstiae]